MGDLVLVNPNSLKNLEVILEQLHENAIKNSERVVIFWSRQTTIVLDYVTRKETISL